MPTHVVKTERFLDHRHRVVCGLCSAVWRPVASCCIESCNGTIDGDSCECVLDLDTCVVEETVCPE